MLAVWGMQAIAQEFVPAPVTAAGYDTPCDPLMARFLPGEFNYCLGRRAWLRGRYEYAIEMLELSAAWGSKPAQQLLGLIYFNGENVEQDRPLGLAWFSLSAERGDSWRTGLLRSALQKVSPEEKREAEWIRQGLKARYADEVAAKRADVRFQREMNRFRGNPAYGTGTCLGSTVAGQLAIHSALTPGSMTTGCSLMGEERMAQSLEERRDHLLLGWKGKVEVGPLEPVEKP
nr:hypothetical protein [Pseudoxanthomonas sp.]